MRKRKLSCYRESKKLELEKFEERVLLSVNNLSDYDQLLIELINRARANPTAEANRYGIDLNQDLAPGTIPATPKPPLAPHQSLVDAAGLYSDDMLARNFFDHQDPDGTLPWDRTEAQGYPRFAGVGENIAWGTFFGSQEDALLSRHENLFHSSGHRKNMLDIDWNEAGTGVTFGLSPYRSVSVSNIDVSLVTEKFGGRTGFTYITGVAFDDSAVSNNFYNIGEGIGDVVITATDQNGTEFTTTSSSSGGYALSVAPGTYTVTAVGGGVNETRSSITVGLSNVKLDFEPSEADETPPDPATLAAIGETGHLTASQASRSQWHQVNFDRSYSNPVVVLGPLTRLDANPATVRIQNVTRTGFEWRIAEWNYLDGAHNTESVGYMVVEAGEHTLPNGAKLVAGKTGVSHRVKHVDLTGLSSTPIVLATVASQRESATVVPRLNNVRANGFDIKLQEQERNAQVHLAESVHFIAVENGGGKLGTADFVVGSTGRTVTHTGANELFNDRFDRKPVLIANIQTIFSDETTGLRAAVNQNAARFYAEEERSADNEIIHVAETVGYFAAEPGTVFAIGDSSTPDPDPPAPSPPANNAPTVSAQSFSIDVSAALNDLVGTVNASDPDDGDTISYSITAGNGSGAFRINASSGRITVADTSQLQPTDYTLTVQVSDEQNATDSAAITINVTDQSSVNAIGESGHLQARQTGRNQWHRVTLQRSYTSPIVALGPLSRNDGGQANVRVRNVTRNSFEWQIDEWDHLDGIHGMESVGYMVIEAGTHQLSDGTTIVAARTGVNHRVKSVPLTGIQGTPVVLATVASTRESSAVVPRLQNVGSNGFRIRLQEQESANGLHRTELVHYIAVEQGAGFHATTPFMVATSGGVTNRAKRLAFGTQFNATPVLLANTQTTNDLDTSGLRNTRLTAAIGNVFVEEERSADNELQHGRENVGFFAIQPGLIDGNNVTGEIQRKEVLVGNSILLNFDPLSVDTSEDADESTTSDSKIPNEPNDTPNRQAMIDLEAIASVFFSNRRTIAIDDALSDADDLLAEEHDF